MTGVESATPPTPFPDVNAVLRDFLVEIRAILGGCLTGMYLYGSLAQGDFDHGSSDIDFIVITERDVTEDQFALLGQMHARFRAGGSYWAEKIEAAYIEKDALNLPGSQSTRYPQLEKGRAFAREPLEIGWPFQRYVLRNHGIVIAGPDPATLVGPVAARELSAAALAITRMWQHDSRADPSWLEWVRQRREQRFVLLTLCRSLYTLERGTLASKSVAARWGQEALERRWALLIERSLMRDGTESLTDQEVDETVAFINYTADRLTHESAG